MKYTGDATYDIIVSAVAILIFCAGIWVGATVSGRHSEAYRQVSIDNAVSVALASGSGLSCKDSEIIDAIKGLAQNGAHIQGFALRLDMGNGVGTW